MIVTRGEWDWGMGEIGEGDQEVQFSRYKISKTGISGTA